MRFVCMWQFCCCTGSHFLAFSSDAVWAGLWKICKWMGQYKQKDIGNKERWRAESKGGDGWEGWTYSSMKSRSSRDSKSGHGYILFGLGPPGAGCISELHHVQQTGKHDWGSGTGSHVNVGGNLRIKPPTTKVSQDVRSTETVQFWLPWVWANACCKLGGLVELEWKMPSCWWRSSPDVLLEDLPFIPLEKNLWKKLLQERQPSDHNQSFLWTLWYYTAFTFHERVEHVALFSLLSDFVFVYVFWSHHALAGLEAKKQTDSEINVEIIMWLIRNLSVWW